MPPLLPTLCITICTTVRKNFAISSVVQLLMYSEKMLSHLAELKLFMYLACITITQSTIITNPIGFNIGLTNFDTRLKQRCINVVSTLFQRRALTLYQRCATLKIRRWILFHFQRRINVISTLIQPLFQR